MLARAGCGGRISDASRPRAQGLPYQKEPAGHACHNCHSERSGSTNAASAEAACGLCRARRRKTNEVQSRIYSGQGYRCFAALNMTVAAALRKEVNDKRSAVKNLSTYTFIQILRRSAPQNDKLLNCSQTPQQTGICNWRERGEVKGKDRCSGRSQLAEINTGDSRASRSPATRRLAKLAPLASAREQLLHRPKQSSRT